MAPRISLVLLLAPAILVAASCASEPARTIRRGPAATTDLPRYVPVDRFFIYAPDVAGGSQPSMEAVAGLREKGYSTIVNLRTPSEMAGIPEAETAATAGLTYLEVPVDGRHLSLVDAVRLKEALAKAPPGDIFIHCSSGNRPAAVWALYLGLTEGLTPHEAVEVARRNGVTKDFLLDRIREELSLAMPKPRS